MFVYKFYIWLSTSWSYCSSWSIASGTIIRIWVLVLVLVFVFVLLVFVLLVLVLLVELVIELEELLKLVFVELP
jgi:hypothetical protein